MPRIRHIALVIAFCPVAGLALATQAAAAPASGEPSPGGCETIGVVCVGLNSNALSLLSVGGGATVNPPSEPAAKPRN